MSVPSDVGRLVSATSNTAAGLVEEAGKSTVGVVREGGGTLEETFKYTRGTVERMRIMAAMEGKVEMAAFVKAHAKELRDADKVLAEHADILDNL